ncbi:MAG: biopolymer transporter ExbD [Methylacidiphilales bacterium]|nr:biopolymer transporter ExbD [Candidatus Methylacidiphilales bacterium]
MQFARKPRRQPVLNIIPLIDVLVVLLIFYIATTVFKKSQPNIVIQVPESTQAKQATGTPPSILYVSSEDKVFLDDTPVDIDKLGDLLKSKRDANPDFKFALKADKKMSFGTLAKIWDAAHAAGIADVNAFMDTTKPGDAGQ